MEPSVIDVEYHIASQDLTEELKGKIEKRIQKLARGNSEITGASVAVQTTSGDSAPREYKARVVVNHRGGTTAAIEKGDTVAVALSNVLDNIERQIRDRREKRRDGWKRGARDAGGFEEEE